MFLRKWKCNITKFHMTKIRKGQTNVFQIHSGSLPSFSSYSAGSTGVPRLVNFRTQKLSWVPYNMLYILQNDLPSKIGADAINRSRTSSTWHLNNSGCYNVTRLFLIKIWYYHNNTIGNSSLQFTNWKDKTKINIIPQTLTNIKNFKTEVHIVIV